ncbi:hypothetical protein DYB36_009525, partial [Aphanomyces astaci]
MTAQKQLTGDMADLDKWKTVDGFEKHTALVYGLLTDSKEIFWALLRTFWNDNQAIKDKTFQGLHALVDIRFLRLAPSCRANLLWLVEQCIHDSVNVDALLIVLMRYVGVTCADAEPSLLEWLVRVVATPAIWDSIVPHIAFTLLSILPELYATKPVPAFLQGQSAFEGRIADLIRKTAAAKTRVLHAMYFDFLHYSPDIPVLQLEPAMMLLLKATKNRNHGMVQDIMTFLVARVDGAPDVAAKVAAAISALIKLGMMRNLLPLVDYLGEFHPALGKQCQAALPLHFTPQDVDMASNWTEQSFLDDTHPSTPSPDRSPPLKTRADVGALAFPESLQVFREPMLALQLVQGMYKQDSVLSSRLLAHCCVHNNLTPYIAFCDMVGLPDVPAAILQDIGLCVHVDQACALACSLLQVPYAGNVAVATTCLGVVPYLLEHAPVACMPRLDALIRSLVSVAPPAVVAKLSMRLLLSEFSIFKDQTATVLLSSLHWNSWEQWGVWELLSAEWQAKHHDK